MVSLDAGFMPGMAIGMEQPIEGPGCKLIWNTFVNLTAYLHEDPFFNCDRD
jgi:hypothetical protein